MTGNEIASIRFPLCMATYGFAQGSMPTWKKVTRSRGALKEFEVDGLARIPLQKSGIGKFERTFRFAPWRLGVKRQVSRALPAHALEHTHRSNLPILAHFF